MVEQLHELNVYQIKQVNGVSPGQIMSCRQLQDLQKAKHESDTTSGEEMGNIPSFSPKIRLKEPPNIHKYATQAERWLPTLVQSTIASMGMDHSNGLSSHAQCVHHYPADAIIESTSLWEHLGVS